MKVSKEELLHIDNLAELNLEENEIENYLNNLTEILDFANVVNTAPVDKLDVTIGANEEKNKFREDKVEVFEDTDIIFKNAPSQEQNMFKIPRVL